MPEGFAGTSGVTMTGCLPQGGVAGGGQLTSGTCPHLEEIRQLRQSVDQNRGEIQVLKPPP